MTRRIRHIRARAGQWTRVHRPRSAPYSTSSTTATARVPVLILLVAIAAASWLAYQLTIAIWAWFEANWVGFIAGLVVVTGIVLYAQRRGGER